MCVADVNKDGRDDVFVGAPYFSSNQAFNQGRVYVYISKKGNTECQ